MESNGKRATAVRICFVFFFFFFLREACSTLKEKDQTLKCAVGESPLTVYEQRWNNLAQKPALLGKDAESTYIKFN